jgi:hypothetical protein
MKRGIGWCIDSECKNWHVSIYLLNHGPVFDCQLCGQRGEVCPETYSIKNGRPFKQVRVEYDFNMTDKRYKAVAIVTDDLAPGNGVYTLRSPLIRTERRALATAERYLANLCCGVSANRPEIVLDFDQPRDTWRRNLERFETQCRTRD